MKVAKAVTLKWLKVHLWEKLAKSKTHQDTETLLASLKERLAKQEDVRINVRLWSSTWCIR